tara:strand:+ start:178 stop:843 length:666 start_codon:yes stop_codon:yes gene_type:complete
LAKRLSEKQKQVIVKCFAEGKTVDELAEDFFCTKLTIIRNLKRNLGEEKYKDLVDQGKKTNKLSDFKEKSNSLENQTNEDKKNQDEYSSTNYVTSEFSPITPFLELTPLECNIENSSQKDLSSVPIRDMEFPSLVYMIVNKSIELETKYLREYPEWQFLAQEELNRKTIEIHYDLKVAKRFCNKEQKVIKIPNTDVFKIVAPLLISKGISRIVSSDKLIAL